MRLTLPLGLLLVAGLGGGMWWRLGPGGAAAPSPAPTPSDAGTGAAEGGPDVLDPLRTDAAPPEPAPDGPTGLPVTVQRPEDLDPALRERYLERWRARQAELLERKMAERRAAEDRWFAELGVRVADELVLAPGSERKLTEILTGERDRLAEAGREARADPDRTSRRRTLDERLAAIYAWKVAELEQAFGPDLARRALAVLDGADEREDPEAPHGDG